MNPTAPDFALTLKGLGSESRAVRNFYQQRMHLFARLGGSLALGYFVITNLVLLATEGRLVLLDFGHPVVVVTAASVLVFGTIGYLTSCRDCAVPFLSVLDIVATVVLSVAFSYVSWILQDPHTLLLPVTLVLMMRVVILPSTALRTAVIGAAGLVPSFCSYAMLKLTLVTSAGEGLTGYCVANFAAKSAVILALTAFTSRVIFGLRESVQVAQALGQYNLERKIGDGGVGEVYLAHHAMLRRPTAVKLLRPEKTSGEHLERFEREVRLTARLSHPNTIRIFDYGRTPEGIFYYAMEFLDGFDLEKLVNIDGPQPPERVIHILSQACGSLAESHGVGLIHRDIKPANIVLCERGGECDVAKVVDFGLVKNLEATTDLETADLVRTTEHRLSGTPMYMAPETIDDPRSTDHRSDLYALGGVGYFLLTGQHPFDGGSLIEILSQHLRDDPVAPHLRLGSSVPADLEALILRCLAKDPASRPQSAAELRGTLARCESAGAWTTEDAEAWWKAHRAAAPPSTADAVAPGTQALTVTVDLLNR